MKVFKEPLPKHSYKFEDFQKSEMIKEQSFEDGVLCTIIFIVKNEVFNVLVSKKEFIKK